MVIGWTLIVSPVVYRPWKRQLNRHETAAQHRFNVGAAVKHNSPTISRHFTANMRHRPEVDLMLAQRLRRWANIKSTSGECVCWVGTAFRVCWDSLKSRPAMPTRHYPQVHGIL